MEHSGVSLPVIEAHCDYRRAARYDDELEVKTVGRILSPVRMEFSYEVYAWRTAWSPRRAGRCMRLWTSSGKTVPPAAAGPRGVRVRALVTGTAGFIGSHLTEALLARGAQVVGIDCFTDYYPREIKEAQPRRQRPHAGIRVRRGPDSGRDLGRLLDGVTHVFHLAAQAGVRKSWGRDFQTYTENNVDASQRLLEACVGRPVEKFVYASSSSLYGDAVSIPVVEDALPPPVVAVRRDEARRRAALSSVLGQSPGADHLGAVLHGVWAAPASGHGVQSLHPGGDRAAADYALR